MRSFLYALKMFQWEYFPPRWVFQTTLCLPTTAPQSRQGLTRQINERRALVIQQLLLWHTRPNWMVHERFTEYWACFSTCTINGLFSADSSAHTLALEASGRLHISCVTLLLIKHQIQLRSIHHSTNATTSYFTVRYQRWEHSRGLLDHLLTLFKSHTFNTWH